jgi:alkanesulfonate monooxygenase SsuD/methylene tetrahydromethanopterin reductase-like flavin-dependent oxidoreductase (luciferase family)
VKFGILGSAAAQRGLTDVDSAAGYRDFIDYVIEAEALGYASTFMVEHHFTGFGQVSATLNLLTWIAAKTSRIRLGTAVTVLPWHNPVLLAEQVATLDLLSGGRLDFGVGKGYRHNEFAGFCIPMEEAEERFTEALAVMTKAWRSDQRFSHHGKYWNFEDIVVEPPTAQKPHPPIWMGAGSPPSIRRVAQLGFNLLLDQFASFEEIGARIALFKAEVETHGRVFDPMSVAVARAFHIAKDQADKEAALDQRMKGQERTKRISQRPDGDNKSSMLSYVDTREASEDAVLFGTMEDIAEKLERLRGLGVSYLILNAWGASRVNLRGFASELLPAFGRDHVMPAPDPKSLVMTD